MNRRPSPPPLFHIGRFGVQVWHLLVPIMVAAAILRFIGLNWDQGYYLHPDERFIVMVTVDTKWPSSIGQYFDSATSPLNPYNTSHGSFIYGTFPLFLAKAIGTLTGHDVYGNAHLAGRFLSALFDTGTVFLTGWIARRFFGRWAQVLATLLIAFTMLNIQSAHFYTVDAMSVFFATATFAAVVRGWDRRSLRWFALAGVMIGLAGACKPNYLIALGFLALPVLETIRLWGWTSLIPTRSARRFAVLPAVVVSALVAFWTFRIAQPYAFAGPHVWDIGLNKQWTDDLAYWRQAQGGLIDVKSSVQWVGRTPLLYITENMVKWGMGWPLGLASLAGLALGGLRLLQSRRWPSWWWTGMIAWTTAQYLLYGLNQAQAQRYLLTVYPFFIVFAAGLLIELARRFDHPERWPRWASIGNGLIAATVLYTVFYGTAFDTLYVRPLSRVQASEWYYDHVPQGSTTTGEYWDDALPMALPGKPRDRYTIITLDLYAYEGPGSYKLSTLMGQLRQADYIVLSSNRVIKSVPQQPERYPLANRYYDMLTSGELGFEEVATFSQVPELFGIRFDDTNAEETLTVYEHPLVRIYKKTDKFNADDVYRQLNAALGYGGVPYLPGDPVPAQLWMTPDQIDSMNRHGTWRNMFSFDGITAHHPVIATWVALELLGIAALPLACLAFRRFPDGGWSLAPLLGLIVTTWIVWWIGSLGLLPFGRLTIGLAAVLTFLIGLIANWRDFVHDLRSARSRLGLIAVGHILLGAALGGFAWLRSLDSAFLHISLPDQRPWYLAMFQGLVRSTTFPPADIWASGGVQHGPYWGLLPWALVDRLIGVAPTIAFTLIPAAIAAVLAPTLWSICMAGISSISHRSMARSAVVSLAAPLLVLFGGGFTLVRTVADGGGGAPRISGTLAKLGPFGDIMYALRHLPRAASDIASLMDHASTVTLGWTFQTPFDALVTGIPSASMTVLPTLLLLVAAALALVLPLKNGRRDVMRWTQLALVGVSVGAVHASALWGIIAAVAIAAMAILTSTLMPTRSGIGWTHIRAGLLQLGGVGAIAVGGFLPYFRQFALSPRNAITGVTVPLDAIEPFIQPLVIALAVIAVIRACTEVLSPRSSAPYASALLASAGVISLLAVWLLNATLPLAATIVVLVSVLCWIDLRDPAMMFIDALGFAGGLLWAVMTTASGSQDPFQFAANHEQSSVIWLLLGLVAAVSLGSLWIRHEERRSRAAMFVPKLGAALTVLVMIATLSGPIATTILLHRQSDSRTLDSTAWMNGTAYEPDRAAARWLVEHIDGTPVLLEGNGGDFNAANRVSTLTGFPTVMGWPGPERVARPGWTDPVNQRQADVNQVYGAPVTFDDIRPLLKQYDVQLIYLGPSERAMYSPVALRKFEQAEQTGALQKIYDQNGVVIYRYDPS